MRKDLGEKPLIYPQPVLLVGTYDADGVPNLMTAAWGCVWGFKEVEINLSIDHKTSQNIRLHKAFTLSMATQDVITAADYVGLVSGKKVADKIEQAGFHDEPAVHVYAPLFRELPLTLECKVLTMYQNEKKDDFRVVGEVVNASVDEAILDENGVIDPAKLKAVSYAPDGHFYVLCAEKVGHAFQDGKTLIKKQGS